MVPKSRCEPWHHGTIINVKVCHTSPANPMQWMRRGFERMEVDGKSIRRILTGTSSHILGGCQASRKTCRCTGRLLNGAGINIAKRPKATLPVLLTESLAESLINPLLTESLNNPLLAESLTNLLLAEPRINVLLAESLTKPQT